MSQIINDLATIEVSSEVLKQLDLAGIYKSFRENYNRLDELKNFRSEYDKQNRLMRWWHNDKLRDAQLNSSEVQAEFSKTIGQLMMISIFQSKELTEQQMHIKSQQRKLEVQTDKISEQAGLLQMQHQTLAEQSAKLENLVHEYFALKGLTEDGAQRLIDIAKQVKGTKDEMSREFAISTQSVEIRCSEMTEQLAGQVDDQFVQFEEQFNSNIQSLEQGIREVISANESGLKNEIALVQQNGEVELKKLEQIQQQNQIIQTEKNLELDSSISLFFQKIDDQIISRKKDLENVERKFDGQSVVIKGISNEISNSKSEMSTLIMQQKNFQQSIESLKSEVVRSNKRLRNMAVTFTMVLMGFVGSTAYLLKLI